MKSLGLLCALAGAAIPETHSIESDHGHHSCHSERRAAIASRSTLPHHLPRHANRLSLLFRCL